LRSFKFILFLILSYSASDYTKFQTSGSKSSYVSQHSSTTFWENAKAWTVEKVFLVLFFNLIFSSFHNPRTPGGSAISPIAEEGRDDLDKLVSDVIRLRGDEGDKVVQNLVAQLRNMIAKWDVAQAQHRQVAKIV